MRSIAALAMIATAACSFAPSPPPSPPRRTSVGLTISRFVVSNGLRVVLVEDARAPRIQVTMRYQVGAIDDPPGREGMAHLVEHLMFQHMFGSEPVFARLEHDAEYFNGFTWLDTTTYVARAQPDRLGELLAIEAVRAGPSCKYISDSVFEREREVVIDELHLRARREQAMQALLGGVYPEAHPYHHRTAGGDDTSVGAITREAACAFADAHYAPKNAVLVVSGPITEAQVASALRKSLGRVASRPVDPARDVPVLKLDGHRIGVPAPIDDEAVVVAWPMPADPKLRAQLRAIAPVVEAAIDERVKGRVAITELGDDRAPALAVIVEPARDEDMLEVLRGVDEGLAHAPRKLGTYTLEQTRQHAIYQLYAQLEDSGDRDARLASYVLAGRDPSRALGEEIAGLRELTRDYAKRLIEERMNYELATIVTMAPSDHKKNQGIALRVAPALHDEGLRRDQPDPSEAQQAAADPGARVTGIRERTLPNGMHVILAPVTTVPTIDVRIVFRAGTADEPVAARGAALLAADALTWDPHHINDLLLFYEAGGKLDVDVQLDRTTFAASGLDMHVDYLLAGLRRLVRDGIYEIGAPVVVAAMRHESKKERDDSAVTAAWRAAVFGSTHPYVRAGLVPARSSSLGIEDARRFRADHFQPDNATLVITGGFDADLADRWIDFLFADWSGHAIARARPSASVPTHASIERVDDRSLIGIHVALPAQAGTRAARLVAAQMLDQIVADVRHQLGASYDLGAELWEARLASNYVIAGNVEAARAAEAMKLVGDRLATLHSDHDAAARAFVMARRRAIVRLGGVTGSASLLAERITRDVELGRPPLSDLTDASAAAKLTLDGMQDTLAELDLARATILLDGPRDLVDASYAAIGRTGTALVAESAPAATSEPSSTEAEPSLASDLVPSYFDHALTTPGLPTRLMVMFAPGVAYSQVSGLVNRDDASGVSITGEVGYRTDASTVVGLHVSYARGSAISYELNYDPREYSVSALDVDGFVEGIAYDRLWGAAFVGLHYDRYKYSGQVADGFGLGAGLEGGVDLLKIGLHRLGVFACAVGASSQLGVTTESLGLTYRR